MTDPRALPTEDEIFDRIMRGARVPIALPTDHTYRVIIRATLAAIRSLRREAEASAQENAHPEPA